MGHESAVERQRQIIDNNLNRLDLAIEGANKAKGERRKEVLLSWLYCYKHSSRGVIGPLLGFNHNSNLTEFLKPLIERDELIQEEKGFGRFPKVITLTRKGWRQAGQMRSEQRIRLEDELREEPWLPRHGYSEPKKINLDLLPHHLLSQMVIAAFGGAVKAVIDTRLRGLKGRQPDAIVEDVRGLRWAIEVDRSPVSRADTHDRVAAMEWMLRPFDRVWDDELPAKGAGGIDRWLMLTRDPYQEARYKEIIINDKCTKRVGLDGREKSIPLNTKDYVVVGMDRFRWGDFRSEAEKCFS